MRTLKSITGAAFALLTLLLIMPAKPASAQSYLHAISDLRTARAILQRDTRPAYIGPERDSIAEISKAIDEMKKAAAQDGMDTWQPPPPQTQGDFDAPFHRAVQLLRDARADVDHITDRPENRGLQNRSIHHIDQALEHLGRYIK
jgi:hypothetical protein